MKTPSEKALDIFGRLVIETMKDNQLRLFDSLCAGEKDNPGDNALQAALAGQPEETLDLMRDMIIQAAAGGAFDFLTALEEMHQDGRVNLTLDGTDLFAAGDDGMAAELFSEEGWDARFSTYPPQESLGEKYMEKFGISYPEAEFDENGDLL